MASRLGRALPWVIGLSVGVDLVWVSPVTGLLATVALAATIGPRVRVRPWLALILSLAALGFAASRGFVAIRQLLDRGHVPPEVARTYVVLGGITALAALLPVVRRGLSRGLARAAERPALALTTSFAGLIAAGTALLALPLSVQRLDEVSLLDAFFTATSAVCVTGLAVNDPGSVYTPFGQAVLLLLIQLGGVGIMTVTALALTASGLASLTHHARYAETLESGDLRTLRTAVRAVLGWTLAIELVGAIALWASLHGDPALAGHSAPWVSLFFSVSAFCNAGFGLLPGSLEPLRDRIGCQLAIMGLITLGGLGVPVLRELLAFAWRRGRGRLSLHARVVLSTSAVLVVGGAIVFLVAESGGALLARSAGGRVLDALFLSVTARTAGFNAIPMGQLADATMFTLMILMFLGGSPGSTAGGIKTTTAAILAAALRGELRRREPRLFDRTLPPEILRRATAVTALSLAVVALFVLVLTVCERRPFLSLAFEAVSAFATVGLSRGITPTLGAAAKLTLIVAMFVGRVGPLTAALAVGEYTPLKHRLPYEEVPVG